MSKTNAYKKPFERKDKKDGTPNPKYVDMLEVDKPIAGQNFGCFSFVSPEKILKQREMYYFEEFLKQWDMNKSMEKFHQFLNFVSFKYKLQFEEVMKDFETFVKEERATIINSSIEDDYKTFLDRDEEDLEKKFNVKHNFQTSVRGFKSRGNFASQEEEELNQLAQEKKKNETIAKSTFEQRIKETKQKAIEENKKNSEKHGNVLTQDIDKDGNLIGAGHNTTESTFASKEPESISVADIRSELFDDANVVIGKSDYGQSQLTSGPFANKKAE